MTASFIRCASSALAAGFILAGCGSSQSAPSGLTPQGLRHKTTGANYLYVSAVGSTIYEFAYPSGSQIAKITAAGPTGGACADTSGDVAVTAEGSSQSGIVYVFADGAATPSQTLTESGEPSSCSYDPSTGNLAVANFSGVAIFANAGGTPAMYTTPSYFASVTSCAYDRAGNLFVGGVGKGGSGVPFVLAELPNGSSSFTQITLDKQIGGVGSNYSVQWNNGVLAVTDLPGRGTGPAPIYRVSISGSGGSVTGSTPLKTHNRNARISSPFTWIAKGHILAPESREGIGAWAYPKGGKRKALIAVQGAIAEAVSSGT